MHEGKILVTGGTGFIGAALCKELLKYYSVDKVVSYSRRWADSEKLEREIDDSRFRTINGDICDWYQVLTATKGIDTIIHTCAYKSVVSAEYNASECKRVNVDGTENLIRAAIENNVKKVLFISTDKACAAINTYGRAKALSESLITNANNLGDTVFSTARYGNVLGSTGSVLPYFLSLINSGETALPITNPTMTRFWFDKDEAVQFVLDCIVNMQGGEVFVPKLKSSTIQDLVTALEMHFRTIFERDIKSMRPGEKMHESMISFEEASRTVDLDWAYSIEPFESFWERQSMGEKFPFDKYTSFTAPRLKTRELQELIGK